MTSFDPGDVVLVRFPFTDLEATKQRPALVLSPRAFAARHGDVVVMPLTSRSQPDAALELTHWKEAGLPRPTWLKPLLGTLNRRSVVRRPGKLAKADRPCVAKALRTLVDRKFPGEAG